MSITAKPSTQPVGIVLGTRDSAPLDFWVGIDEGQMLQLDDLVVVKTLRLSAINARDEHGIELVNRGAK